MESNRAKGGACYYMGGGPLQRQLQKNAHGGGKAFASVCDAMGRTSRTIVGLSSNVTHRSQGRTATNAALKGPAPLLWNWPSFFSGLSFFIAHHWIRSVCSPQVKKCPPQLPHDPPRLYLLCPSYGGAARLRHERTSRERRFQQHSDAERQ